MHRAPEGSWHYEENKRWFVSEMDTYLEHELYGYTAYVRAEQLAYDRAIDRSVWESLFVL